MDSKVIINRITQQLTQASNSSSKTEAGLNKTSEQPTEDLIDAINQIFALFRFNYHNQFTKAYPDIQTMNTAKKLWSRLLLDFSGEVIMRAAEQTVKESSWLPSVHEVLRRCDRAEVLGVPSAHAAYMEACRAPSPKRQYSWSHPAVYFAGLATDWFFLANEVEEKAFPVFQRNYEILLKRLQDGESLEIEVPQALPETVGVVAPKEEQHKRMSDLLKQLEG